MRSIFFGEHALRAGWRLLLFIALFTALSSLFAWAAIALVYHGRPPAGFTAGVLAVSDGVSLIAALIAGVVLARATSERLASYGLAPRGDALARLGQGALWGLAAVAAIVAIIAIGGGLTISGFALHGAALARAAVAWLATMLILGAFEEFLFRGPALTWLTCGMGFWPAALLLSAFFGGLHYFTKPNELVLDALNVALIGLYLCLTIRRTGNLWFAIGMHAAFDYAALVVVGAPNTGNLGRPLDDHLLATTFHGSAWLTGGTNGIEASVAAFVIAIALVIAEIARRGTRERPGASRAPESLRPIP